MYINSGLSLMHATILRWCTCVGGDGGGVASGVLV